ncbi:MAG TPA: hypothetical protein VM166_12625 [Gemmatimonadaceae bacterium]|nr:hypothetical protein [Gemmatimonadaceae bacterium]
MPSRTSYEFHESLEPFSAFIRREWKPAALFGGLFVAAALAVIFSVDPAFFYPRLQTDPLRYLMKAHAFIETGSTTARAAINLPPFLYAAMPGVMRVPLIVAFKDFDDQWRAIQATNVIFAGIVALMSAYIFSWSQPAKRHWMTIALAFAFSAIAPWWIANILYPLADAPYAACTLGALILSRGLVTSQRPLRSQLTSLCIFAILFVFSFLLRFSAPVILVFAGTLAHGRWSRERLSSRAKLFALGLPFFIVAGLVFFNRDAIFGRYLHDPLWFIRKADDGLLVLNIFASAIPSQIIPAFNLAYSRPPVMGPMNMAFATTPRDLLWAIVGIAVSAVVILGAWRSRQRYLPELIYVLAPLPLLAPIVPSVARYLASYQPFFWIFFSAGASALLAPLVRRMRSPRRTAIVVAAAGGLALAALGAMRLRKVVGTANPSQAVSVLRAPAYFSGVAKPFHELREFIETLPTDRTLLIGAGASTGRWKVISGRDYYVPDPDLANVVRSRDVYLLAECGTLEICRDFGAWTRRLEDGLAIGGSFSFEPVFERRTAQAQVAVFRVSAVP